MSTLNIPATDSALGYVGIGFKPRYFEALIDAASASPGWLEIHAENYMVDGGPKLAMLDTLRRRFPLSCHGVGLSIGADAPLDRNHLNRLRRLQDELQPALFSEHLAWSSHGRNYYNDLLPIAYTDATLERVVEHVEQMQQALGRQILLENPSGYLTFADSTWHEAEFLAEVIHRSGCGLLLDINNVYVSATNLRFDPHDYLQRLPLDCVGEIHLAGHACDRADAEDELLIDSHDEPVANAVWKLFSETLCRVPRCPVLIERDGNLPPFAELLREVVSAAAIIDTVRKAA